MRVICALLLASSALPAQQLHPQRVVVLEGRTTELSPWPEGQAAVVAELRANGYVVELRPSPVQQANELDSALMQVDWDVDVVGALAISKEGRLGVARVRTKRFGLDRLETALSDGDLSRSRFALAVVDRVRLVDIPKSQPRAAKVAPRIAGTAPPVAALWLGAGVVSAGRGAIWPWASVSASWFLRPPFAVEADFGLSLLPTRVSTPPGEVDLRAERAMAYVAFEALAGRRFSLALGLGGGMSLVHGRALASPGFRGSQDVAQIASLGARARGSVRFGNALISLGLEPGVLLPAVQLQEASSTVLTLGRPWLAGTVAIGWLL